MSLTISHPAPVATAPGSRSSAAVAPALRPRLGFTLLIAMLALAACGQVVLHSDFDPDLFWHLRVGQRLAALPFPRPLVDDLSFSSIRTPWSPYSWLAEMGMNWIWQRGGFRAALAIEMLVEAAMVLFIALSARELTIAAFGEARYFAAAVAAFVAEFLAVPYWSFRPVTFSLMLLAAGAWILQRDRRLGQRSAAIWLLVPLTALSINFHFFAMLCPAFVFALATCAWWERRMHQCTDAEATRRLRRYILFAVATSAACLATPMLPGMIQAVWHYQFNDVLIAHAPLAELIPFYRASPLAPFAAAMVILFLVLAIVHRRRLPAGDILWLAMSLALLLRMGRFAPVFAIFAAPALAIVLPRLSDRLLSRRVACGLLALVISIHTVRIAAAFPRANMTLDQWLNRLSGQEGYPCAAADFVASHVCPRSRHLINEFNWGGFLDWRLGDTYQTLLDSRAQVYTSAFWNATFLGTPTQRKDYLATVSADAAILPRRNSIFSDPLRQLGWSVAYHDDQADVMLPPSISTSIESPKRPQ